VLLSAILTVGVQAQDTAKKETPVKPAASPSQAVLQAWNDIGRKLIAMAEDFPEDKYDFKATLRNAVCRESSPHLECQLFFHQYCPGAKTSRRGRPQARAIQDQG